MQILVAALVFLFSSGYVLLLDFISNSPRDLQKALILPLIILVAICFYSFRTKDKQAGLSKNKWLLLFWGSVFVQLLVVSSGGLQSPFLILIHLFMITLSFIVSFFASFLFLLFSFVVILLDITKHQELIPYLENNLNAFTLQFISLISIIPIAFIVSLQYHLKTALLEILHVQVKTDETILEKISELIVVTDADLNVLSVNDAVERTLRKSRSELFNKPIFSILLLRDSEGKVADKETFLNKDNTINVAGKLNESFTLVSAPTEDKKFSIKVQPMHDVDASIKQLSFILSVEKEKTNAETRLELHLEQARAKYEALMENLKRTITSQPNEAAQQIQLIERIGNDIYNVQDLAENKQEAQRTQVDLAQLVKQTVLREQDFAKMLHVELAFKLENFGKDDIEPLVKNFEVQPEQFTGPFFTIESDIKKLGLLIQKLTDLNLLLASTNQQSNVNVTVARKGKEEIMVTMQSQCPSLQAQNKNDLFLPYYGKLAADKGLATGSGFEGYLVKIAADTLGVPMAIDYSNDTATITFTFTFNKSSETANRT